jgi:fibronectin type 3 domain-containing protein
MKRTQWLYGIVFAGLIFLAGTVGAQVTSALWGVNGETWDPETSILNDFSDVGYMSGDVAIPTNWPVGVDVTDYGAVPDDEISDFDAFMAAISNCPPGHAIFVPKGTYWITDCLKVSDKSNFVLRGEDMYETVLYFPTNMSILYPEAEYDYRYSVIAPPAVWWMQGGTNMNIEHITIEFSEDPMIEHFNHDGRQAINYMGVSDSWIRNVCIRNANDGVVLWGARRVTAMNIVMDQYAGRPSGAENTVGHHGLVVKGARDCLFHNCFITGMWQHDLISADTDVHNVYSRIRMIDGQIDHHAMGANPRDNLWTDIDCGEGLRIWEQGGNVSGYDETIWNVYRTTATGTTNRMFTPDPGRRNVVVGLQNDDPSSIGSNWWHEAVNPYELTPQNIYLAQLEKKGKWIPGPLIDFDIHPKDPYKFVAVDDSYVYDGGPDNNYSWHETYPCRRNYNMLLQHKARNMHAFLRFDLSDSEFANVESAVLSIPGWLTAGSSVRVTAAAVTDDNWTEDTLTWNTRPTENGADLDTVTVINSAMYEFDVTDFVNQELAGDKIVTIRLYQPDSNDARASFKTHEGRVAFPPTIKLVPAGVDQTPPAAPTGLEAVPANSSASLNWNANTDDDLDSYTVYRSLTSGSSYSAIQTGISTNAYVDHTVVNYTTYYYKVSATDTNSLESELSAYVSVTPVDPDNQAPSFFSDPILETNAMEGAAYAATLADDASDPESDVMTFVKLSGPGWLDVAGNGTLSGTPESSDTGTNIFSVQVSAAGGTDTAELQIIVDVDTVTPPSAPTGLTVAVDAGAVALNWDNNTEGDLAGYSVYRSTSSGGYTLLVSGLTESQYDDTAVENGITYYYVVTATDIHSNESAYSQEVPATPSATISTFVTASENAGLNGAGAEDESIGTLALRNRYGYEGQSTEKYAYLRFAMDAVDNTVGGVAVGDITFVTLNLHFTAYNLDSGKVFALDDLANPGAGFLTETTWSATGSNELSGPVAPHGNVDIHSSALVTELGDFSGSGLSGTGVFKLTLDLAEFKIMVANSSNNEFTLIIDGPVNGNNVIASLENDSGYAVPTLEIGAEATLIGYDSWASDHGVGAATNDFDADGINNLYEYGLNGNPTNPAVLGTLPVFSKSGNRFLYIHPKRSDDPALIYTVETTTNLMDSGSWTNDGYTMTGTNITGETLDFVTNDVDIVDSEKFIRLKIEQ